MTKTDLKDMMNKRTPLHQREVVAPADMYTSGQVDESTNPQVDTRSSTEKDVPSGPALSQPLAISLADETSTSGHVDKSAKPGKVRYTTYLRPDTIKAVKKCAFDTDINDHDVVQAALDEHFSK